MISVIIPVYKVEAYLKRCVESIVNQTYQNLEIILVDDGSPDRCPILCDGWAQKDNRIRVIHKENGGLSDARNAGMAVATGGYISFVDSDDWVESDFLQTMFDLLQKTKADIAECGVKYIDERGNQLRQRGIPQAREELGRVDAVKRLLKEDGVYQTVWNKLYRRGTIGNVLFEKGKLHEDDFWTYQIFDKANKVVVIHKPLYNYFQRSDSIMGAGYRFKNLDGLQARHRQVEYFANDPELAEFVKARVLYTDLYHFQCVLRYLEPMEQKMATDTMIHYMQNLGKVNFEKGEIPRKYRLWLAAFRRWPFAVAKLRNFAGIGL